MHIVSVSRRCDIPRFHFDEFMRKLDEGYTVVTNPFNANQQRRVSLLPEDVGAFVFWTRDPRPVLTRAGELEAEGYRFYVMVTVTGYPRELEPGVPPSGETCAAMRELSLKIGGRRVIWRYDPVFLSSVTDAAFHRENFRSLAEKLQGAVQRVIVSLYDEYRGAKRRVESLVKAGAFSVPPEGDTGPLFAGFAETARAAGMEIQTCAEAESMERFGIKAGACIDGELLRDLWGVTIQGRDKNQRPHCLCAQSVDIGNYGGCPAGCVYCYAR
jgi:hypothetical protein